MRCGQQNYEDTVRRSLAGGDRIYLPMILKDFPDFNVDYVKSAAEAYITNCLLAVERKNSSLIAAYGEGIAADTAYQMKKAGRSKPAYGFTTPCCRAT